MGGAAWQHPADLECCAEELEVADVADPQVDVLPGHLAPSGRFMQTTHVMQIASFVLAQLCVSVSWNLHDVRTSRRHLRSLKQV